MSVIIVFPHGADWFKANWVFRQLAQDVSDRYGSDAEVCKAVEAAEALGALDLKKMSDGLRKRVMEALSAVAMDTIEGTIAGWRPHDAEEHALYCEAVSELSKCLKGQDNIGA
jgi:predicted RNA-binding Zn ribbon-like protein